FLRVCSVLLSFFCFLLPRRPPSSPLFPYTTLFRSVPGAGRLRRRSRLPGAEHRTGGRRQRQCPATGPQPFRNQLVAAVRRPHARSEEHTSELQSRENLVCRLLLEKKKTKTNDNAQR